MSSGELGQSTHGRIDAARATLGDGWLPPVHRREFWAIQGLVLLIAALHTLVEAGHLIGDSSPLYLVPITLYLIPCVYAAVVFGVRGALLTAIWSGVLVVLNVMLWHEGLERVGELVQVAWIGLAAVFVGSRVDRERAARLEAEDRESARRASEERARAIMDNVAEPIILLDHAGTVLEANQSAAGLLDRSVADLRGGGLPGPAGAMISRAIDSETLGTARVTPMRLGRPARWFELLSTATEDPDGTHDIQLLLRDVTDSFEREQGLESIARETLATREEEQRRIARELHDGPLQSLIHLWRSLDALASDVPDTERAAVVAARTTAEDVANELRRFSRDLRPSVLDDLGIGPAIRAEAEALRQRTSIAVDVHVEGRPQRLEEDVELALLRITQEAVRNIERHADASSVAITLEFGRSRVRLAIADDGRGMGALPTVSELLADDHLGLVGMQERARLVGGRLSITAPTAGGTIVEALIPIGELPHR